MMFAQTVHSLSIADKLDQLYRQPSGFRQVSVKLLLEMNNECRKIYCLQYNNGKQKVKREQLYKLGVPRGEPARLAVEVIKALAAEGKKSKEMEVIISRVVKRPTDYLSNGMLGSFANALSSKRYSERKAPAPYKQWGKDLEPESVKQMENACRLPVSVAGALMPDAHLGYGLPIGGVLATDNAVIPYAVGVDIACRMKMTVLDIPVMDIESERGRNRLIKAIESETRFGVGSSFKRRRQHDVMDEDWSVSHVTSESKDKAWAQLGTSGSGNHFVEFGTFTIPGKAFNLEAGTYLALLSHSGSRGAGAKVASYYSKLAQSQHPELPRELIHLAWLDMNGEDGIEYWQAMELMGKYAAGNHSCIHQHIAKNLGVDVLLDIENHHNFAWKERHLDRDVIVHRKGATPADKNDIGIIPGTMATPAFIVSGKGNPESLNSAAHGAGRVMSRRKAMRTLSWKDAKRLLTKQGVTLLSAGLDEVPMVYKNIEKVMRYQNDLVTIIGKFMPRIVKMAPHGERPED